METRKNLLIVLGEWLEARRVEPSVQQGRLGRRLRWLLPNGGTLLIVVMLLVTQSLWARPFQSALSVPGPSATTVNYQGRLADNAGTPLDGTYGMSFALYDAATGGTMVWGPEPHTAVPVSEGLFSVGLGSQTSSGIPTTVWNGDRYLEITVGGETLSPRELIRSVPIAGMALTVTDGAIGANQIANGAVGASHIADGAIGSKQMSPSWYETYDESVLSTTSTTPVPTETSLNFTCEMDCTALILHRGLVAHSLQNGRVDVRIKVNGESVARELGVVNAGYANGHPWEPVSSFSFVNLPAGSHTVEVEFYCHGATPGTCYYSGWHSDWEHLNVLLFSQ